MKRFSFNLQRLLDYKRTLEDALLAELAAIRAEHGRERSKLLEMIHTRDTFSRKTRQSLAEDGPEQIKRAHAYLTDLTRQVAAQEIRVRELADKRDLKTVEVIEASKERKSLDRLRERKEEEHRLDARRTEQIFLDDIACIRSRPRECGVGDVR